MDRYHNKRKYMRFNAKLRRRWVHLLIARGVNNNWCVFTICDLYFLVMYFNYIKNYIDHYVAVPGGSNVTTQFAELFNATPGDPTTLQSTVSAATPGGELAYNLEHLRRRLTTWREAMMLLSRRGTLTNMDNCGSSFLVHIKSVVGTIIGAWNWYCIMGSSFLRN